MKELGRALLIVVIMALFFSGTIVEAQNETPSVTPDPFPAYTNDNTPTFTGTAIGSGAPIRRVEYRVDSRDWIGITDPHGAQPVDGDWDEPNEDYIFTTATLSDGSHTVEVRAIDSAGYTTPPDNYAIATFTVEHDKPSVTIVPLSPDPTNDPTPTLIGTATDITSPITSVEYRVGSGDWIAAEAIDGAFDSTSEAYTFTTTTLTNGQHTVQVKAKDAADNWTTAVNYASDIFTVDTNAPSITIADIPSFVNALASISGTAYDTSPGVLDKIQIVINNNTDGTYWDSSSWNNTETWLDATGTTTWSYSMPTLTNGTAYVVKARSIDTVGNISIEASDSFAFDTMSPPTPTLLSPANQSLTNDTTPSLNWNDVIDPSGVSYSLQIDDDADFSSPKLTKEGVSVSQYTLTAAEILSDSTYHWRVQSSDYAGNEGNWTPTWSFTIDTTIPSVTINDIPSYVKELVDISGTASDIPPGKLDKVQVLINNTSDKTYWDGTSWVTRQVWLDATGTTTWSYPMPSLISGKAYVVKAKSIDWAGNESIEASESFTFTTPPVVSLYWLCILVPACLVLVIVLIKRRKAKLHQAGPGNETV